MGEYATKWGLDIEDTNGHFLLGASINIGNSTGYQEYYICLFIGFKTLVIGKFI